MHGTGWLYVSGSVEIAGEIAVDANPVHLAARASTWSLPTTGMLFSETQAMRQALQPVHDVRSIDMPHL